METGKDYEIVFEERRVSYREKGKETWSNIFNESYITLIGKAHKAGTLTSKYLGEYFKKDILLSIPEDKDSKEFREKKLQERLKGEFDFFKNFADIG